MLPPVAIKCVVIFACIAPPQKMPLPAKPPIWLDELYAFITDENLRLLKRLKKMNCLTVAWEPSDLSIHGRYQANRMARLSLDTIHKEMIECSREKIKQQRSCAPRQLMQPKYFCGRGRDWIQVHKFTIYRNFS